MKLKIKTTNTVENNQNLLLIIKKYLCEVTVYVIRTNDFMRGSKGGELSLSGEQNFQKNAVPPENLRSYFQVIG